MKSVGSLWHNRCHDKSRIYQQPVPTCSMPLLSSSVSAHRLSANFKDGFTSIAKTKKKLKSVKHLLKPPSKLSAMQESPPRLTWNAWPPRRRTLNVLCQR